MSGLRERIAEVHTAHMLRWEGGHFECDCGEWSSLTPGGHAEHVADVLLPLIAAERDEAARQARAEVDEWMGNAVHVSPPDAQYRDDGPDHQHGHTWRITIHSQGHYCTGFPCTDPERHADYWDRTNTVEVKGSSLPEALERASQLPIRVWLEGEDEQER